MFIKGNFLVLFAFPLKTLYPTANSVKSVALLVNFVFNGDTLVPGTNISLKS